ncbi:MAG TPA: CPBP family intramembrane glutamic endopeptidase [Phycisphaerales bacterium]|nr:CPBP family intramembrane glutamic endopeptidase [Phycisphaerales bacterium]
MLTFIDHILTFLLIVGLPLYGAIEYRRLKARRAKQRAQGLKPEAPEYHWTIAIQWGLTAVMICIWLWHGYPWRDLGVTMPPDRSLWSGWGFIVIAVLTLALVVMQIRQNATVRRSASTREKIRGQIASVLDLLPSSRRELHWFYGLSLTAGVCEELLYRGWMLWYLSHSMNMWIAVALSAVIFGVAHSYQGVGGIIKTGLVGLVVGLMYAISGSLWLPMLLHAAVDVLSGRMAFDVLTMDRDGAPIPGEGERSSPLRYDQPHASAGPSAA